MVLAEDGKKMSKRLKNYTPPDELMASFGADALRLYLINSGLVKAEEQRFSDIGVKDMTRRALLPWYNAFKFFSTYAKVDEWTTTDHFRPGDNILDKWLLSNLQTLKKNVTTEMEAYKLYNVVPALFTFIEDLTNWYIRLNRSRFWSEGMNEDKMSAYSTLYVAIKELSLTMAPFAPYLSEYIFQEIGQFEDDQREESVHLCSYPEADETLVDPLLEDAVGRIQQLILLGRQKRNQVQIKVKTPLARLTVIHHDQKILNEIKKLESYIQTELNVKTIEYSTEESKFINFFARPNAPVLGKQLGKEFGKFSKLIKELSSDQLLKMEEKGFIEIDGRKFESTDILIFREAKEGTEALSNRFISIDMDCQLSDELVAEGLAREVVNRIQKTRKDLNFNVDDRIEVIFSGSEDLVSAIDTHRDYISKETLSLKLEKGQPSQNVHAFKVEKHDLNLQITRV